MAREGEHKKFWSSKRIITLGMVAIAIIFGALIQHYYIEPMIGQTCVEDLRICKAQVKVLDEESRECYQKNYDLNRLLKACEYDLQRYQETP